MSAGRLEVKELSVSPVVPPKRPLDRRFATYSLATGQLTFAEQPNAKFSSALHPSIPGRWFLQA